MLRSIKPLLGHELNALDGNIGKVHDLLFDDESWHVRYLVADTGSWLVSRMVLISTNAVGKPDWEEKQFPVNLTKKKIENSPTVDQHKPLTRSMEYELSDYYGWPYYWATEGGGIPFVAPTITPEIVNLENARAEESRKKTDPHLRSVRDVSDYSIQALDDRIGNVEDFIFEDDSWQIRYLVIDMGNWLLSGKKTLIALSWIKDMDWKDGKVNVDLTVDEIKNSPEYDPDKIIDREFETKLFTHYKREKYWNV